MKPAIAIGVLLSISMLVSGCLTFSSSQRPRVETVKESEALRTHIAALENQISGLNRQIGVLTDRQQALESELIGARRQPTKPKTVTRLSKRQIQLALQSAGFYQGPIDGKIGPKTRTAVKDFQRSEGLKPDGLVGTKTKAALARVLRTEYSK